MHENYLLNLIPTTKKGGHKCPPEFYNEGFITSSINQFQQQK